MLLSYEGYEKYMEKGEANPLPVSRVHTVGRFTVVEGRLGTEDHRSAYVVGPVGTRQAPIASFWSFAEALQWAKARNI